MNAVADVGVDDETIRLGGELRVVVGRMARRLRQEHRAGDLTFSEISVLSRLDRNGPRTPGQLADAERVRPQAMTATVRRLQERALVMRGPDASDARRALMAITAPGRAVLTDLRRANTALMARGLAEFTEPERARLREALPLLERLAGTL